MFDWNDLKYFLAVAEEGSTLKAAHALGANQTTVARRISALEAAFGLPLFERRQSGYRLTQAGEGLLEKASSVAAAATALQIQVESGLRATSGTVRLSTNDLMAEAVLPPMLIKLREKYPAIKVEIDQSQEVRDLGKGEADIALRQQNELKGDALIARLICLDPWNVWASKEFAERNGLPKRARDLKNFDFIGGGGGSARVFQRWIDDHVPGLSSSTDYDSMSGMLSALRAGMGLTFMSSFVVKDDPNVIPCFPQPEGGYKLWLLTHERIRKAPHIRAVMTELGDMLVARAKTLNLPRG